MQSELSLLQQVPQEPVSLGGGDVQQRNDICPPNFSLLSGQLRISDFIDPFLPDIGRRVVRAISFGTEHIVPAPAIFQSLHQAGLYQCLLVLLMRPPVVNYYASRHIPNGIVSTRHSGLTGLCCCCTLFIRYHAILHRAKSHNTAAAYNKHRVRCGTGRGVPNRFLIAGSFYSFMIRGVSK